MLFTLHHKNSIVFSYFLLFCLCVYFLAQCFSETDKIVQLRSLLCEYIWDQLTQTNIFGPYVNLDANARDNEENEDIVSKNKIVKNMCKKLVFNDNFDELNKLTHYCLTQNITNIESYEDGELDVIVSFIVNELTYVIYHDLTIDSINSNNKNSNVKIHCYFQNY